MSDLSDFIDELKTAETHPGYVVKYIRARDLVFCLKAPKNMKRDLRIVPDVQIKLLLSTNGKQPEFIAQKIRESEVRDIFQADTLMGLCLNGRGLNPEIFLNGVQMAARDPSGELFDEIAWHEYMHAVEGIKVSRKGIRRDVPWSYALQKLMLKIDHEMGHDSEVNKLSGEFQKYVSYLREGTSLQQNVSEIFARVGVLFYNNIQETGNALTSQDEAFFDPAGFDMNYDTLDRKTYNLTDLFYALSTYSPDSQGAFWHFLPESLDRVARLYGCRSPS